jgi:hypothetical protein
MNCRTTSENRVQELLELGRDTARRLADLMSKEIPDACR